MKPIHYLGANHFGLGGSFSRWFREALPLILCCIIVFNLSAGATPISSSAEQARGLIVINEINYHPTTPGASFVELRNISSSQSFDISGWVLSGTGLAFQPGVILPPNSHHVVVANRIEFARIYGQSILPLAEFPGDLDNGGETLKLVKPPSLSSPEIVVDEVRFDDDPPWPSEADGFGSSLQLIDPVQDHQKAGNWFASPTNATVLSTPAAPNTLQGTLPAFLPIHLNEIAPQGTLGMLDNAGDTDPWIELYNPSDVVLELTDHYLSNDGRDPYLWSFPAGTRIAAKGFLIVWLDGEPNESTPDTFHTSFKPTPENGSVIISRRQSLGVGGLDGIQYVAVTSGRSFGSFPDGSVLNRKLFHFPTPLNPNNGNSLQIGLKINEWMASNSKTISDVADGDFEDWFELFNPTAVSIDLSGYYLTDSLTNKSKFKIPNGVKLEPNNYLMVWADEETSQYQPALRADLHTNFKLAASGEAVGIYAPDGTLVDSVIFAAQTNDISQLRFPDGMGEPFHFSRTPTPGSANRVAPFILRQPDDLLVDSGARIQLLVEATGSTPLNYQWKLGENIITGATNASYVIESATQLNAGFYSVIVTNTSGGVESRRANILVQPPGSPQVRLIFGSGNLVVGGKGLVPLNVQGFKDVTSIQASIVWNPGVAVLKTVHTFGLDSLTLEDFGMAQVSSGVLLLGWDDPSGVGKSLADGSLLFVLEFETVGGASTRTAVNVSSTPLATEVALSREGQLILGELITQAGALDIVNEFRLNGVVRYFTNDRVIPGSRIHLTSGLGTPDLQRDSNSNGEFFFQSPPHSRVTITVTDPSTTTPSAGVTTLDITLLRRHILGIQILEKPHQLLAGDVNASGSISTLDITYIRRLILGISTSLPGGNWRFVPSNYIFEDVRSPFNAPQGIVIEPLDKDWGTLHFYGIKLGDVNGSWVP